MTDEKIEGWRHLCEPGMHGIGEAGLRVMMRVALLNACDEIIVLKMLVRHFVMLGPRPDHLYAEPTDADLELQTAWDAAWNALVARAEAVK